ncbi:Hexaprenyldihydroxybenzoate methyltransferase, mitochondrial, partial [Kappamyces sp. JEL0680]
DLVLQDRQFDAVCGLEIVEHVTDPKQFIQDCVHLLKPGGFLFLSTINRTPLAFLATIVMAEHVLNWVPKGTHSIEKYVTPSELEAYCKNAGTAVLDTSAMTYNPLTRAWSLVSGPNCAELQMNYIQVARKETGL